MLWLHAPVQRRDWRIWPDWLMHCCSSTFLRNVHFFACVFSAVCAGLKSPSDGNTQAMTRLWLRHGLQQSRPPSLKAMMHSLMHGWPWLSMRVALNAMPVVSSQAM